jgi:hypothetical protein
LELFHNAQWYWSDNLCKLVTDQWRGSLGVPDSESCWFTEEIGTYMHCWESLGDLHKLSDQYHWALWNTHHIKLTLGTPIDKLSSFLLIFELFSLTFYWKYSIVLLHSTGEKTKHFYHSWKITRSFPRAYVRTY